MKKKSGIDPSQPYGLSIYEAPEISGESTAKGAVTREMLLRGIPTQPVDVSIKDMLSEFLALGNNMAASSAVRWEKALGVARPDVAARSWEDLGGEHGFEGYFQDVATHAYKWSDTRMMEPFGRAVYAINESGAWNMIQAARAAGTSKIDMYKAVLQAIPASRMADIYSSDAAGRYNKNDKYSAIVNLPADIAFDFINPLFALQTHLVQSAEIAARGAFWDKTAEHLIRSKASWQEIADYLITHVEGAPVAHDGLVNTFEHFVKAGDAEGIRALGLAAGGWQKTFLSIMSEKYPILKYFKATRAVSNPKLLEFQMRQLKISRHIETKMEQALETFAPLRESLAAMNKDELAAFTLINGSASSLEKWKLTKIVEGRGFQSTPLIDEAVKQLGEVVGYDAGERSLIWYQTKAALDRAMTAESEAHVSRLTDLKGAMDDLAQKAVSASPSDAAKISGEIDGLKAEGRAISRRIGEIAQARIEMLSKDAPPLIKSYTVRLRESALAGELADPLQEVHALFTMPGYLQKKGTADTAEKALASYGINHEALREDLTKLYEGLALRATRADKTAQWGNLVEDLGRVELGTAAALARVPVGSNDYNALKRLSEGLGLFRDNALRHLESLPRPTAGQRSLRNLADETAPTWDNFHLLLNEARREVGRRMDVLRSASDQLSHLFEESGKFGIGNKRVEETVAAAEKQMTAAWDKVKAARQNVDAVGARIKAVSQTMWDNHAALRNRTKDQVQAGWKALNAEREATVGAAELEHKGGYQELEALKLQIRDLGRQGQMLNERGNPGDGAKAAKLFAKADKLRDEDQRAIQLVLDANADKIKTLRKLATRRSVAWKKEIAALDEAVIASSKNAVKEIDSLRAIHKGKIQEAEAWAKRANEIKKDIAELRAGKADSSSRAAMQQNITMVKREVETAKAAYEQAAIAAGRLTPPDPSAVMKVHDNVLDAYDTMMNAVKRNWLFGNPTRFIATNLDNFAKTFRETGVNYTPTMVRVTGEPIVISPRTNFAEDLTRADPRGNPGAVERGLSYARDHFPFPVSAQAKAVAWEERVARGMQYDYHYQRKAKELLEAGVTGKDSMAAIDSAASAFAEKQVDKVQFMGEKHAILGRAMERIMPFSMTYGVPAVKDAARTLIERPMYAHTLMNVIDSLNDADITHDGQVEVGGGYSLKPATLIGMSQTFELADSIRLRNSAPYLYAGNKRDDYTMEPAPGSLSYDKDRFDAAKQAGALMSARGTPIKISPLIGAAWHAATDRFTEKELDRGATSKIVGPLAKEVLSPQDSWLKAAGYPGGINEVMWKIDNTHPEDTGAYVNGQVDRIIFEGNQAGKVFSRDEAFAMYRWRSQVNALGLMTGSGLKVSTPQERDLKELERTYRALPVEARTMLRNATDEDLQFIKLFPKYNKGEPRPLLESMDKATPDQTIDQIRNAAPEEKKTLLQHFLQKISGALPSGDSTSVSPKDVEDAMAALSHSRLGMAASLFAPGEAQAADIAKRVEDVRTRAADTFTGAQADGNARMSVLHMAEKAGSEEGVAKLVVSLTNPKDPATALEHARQVLAEQRLPQPRYIADGQAEGGMPLLLRGTEGPTMGAFQFYNTPDVKTLNLTPEGRATVMALALAQKQAQTSFSGLLSKFETLVQNGSAKDFEDLKTNPLYTRWMDKNSPAGGAQLYDKKGSLGFLTSPETNLSIWLKTGELPQGVGIRLQKQNDAAYPGDSLLRSRLQTAADHRPQTVNETVDMINAASKQGFIEDGGEKLKVSPDFWGQLKSSDAGNRTGNPGLLERAAKLDGYDDLYRLSERVSIRSASSGRLLGLSIPAMVHAIEEDPDNRLRLSILREGPPGFQAFASLMEKTGAGWGNKGGVSLDTVAPVDPSFTGSGAQGDFAFRVGLEAHPFVAAFENASHEAPADSLSGMPGAYEDASGTRRVEIATPKDGIQNSSSVPQSRPPEAPVNYSRPLAGAAPAQAPRTEASPEFHPLRPVSNGVATVVRDRGYDSVGSWLSDTINQSRITGNSLMVTGTTLLRTEAGLNAQGEVVQGGFSLPIQKTLGAVTSLAQISNQLEGQSNPMVGQLIGGASVGMGVYSAGAALAGAGMYATSAAAVAAGASASATAIGLGASAGTAAFSAAAATSAATGAEIAAGTAAFGPVGWIIGGTALAVGALYAAGVFGGKGGPSREVSEEANRLREKELALQRERFDEQMKQQSISDLRNREQTIAKSIGGLSPAQRAPIEQHLATFTRRPTYQSRIGLADVAERAIGSAIHPRW